MDPDESTAAPGNRGWMIALAFVGVNVVIAVLFVLYVLLWDGGAHT